MFGAFRSRRSREAGVGRRQALRLAGGAFSGAALAGLMQVGAGTRRADAAQAGQGIEGLWRATTVGGQSMGAPIFTQYLPDGSIIGLYPDARIAFLGRWTRTGERTFETTIYQHRRDADGASVGITKVQNRIDLNERLDRSMGIFKSVFFDLDGNVVENRQGTTAAERLVAEPYD